MRLEPAPRLPRAPLWVLAGLLGLGALAAAALLERRWGVELTTCLFKRLTGQPCPTCGATRAVLALLAGHPLRALAFNPLLGTGGALAAAWFLFRAATGLELRFEGGRTARRTALAVALAAVLANWGYLVLRGI